MKLLLIAAFTAILTFAQTQPQSGAKALFFSPESGQETPALPPGATRRSGLRAPSAAARSGSAAEPAITGLKYYIELREPDGILQRVNANRVFHSGDRIRLHVQTNVDGDLVIYQKQEDLPEERLYPASGIPDATGRVMHGVDVTLPSAHGWFRFDDHPGQIHLTLMLTAKSGQAASQTDANHHEEIPTAEMAHQIAAATKGSKALRIEDDSVDDNAEYKVVDSRLDAAIPAGVIATEVTLSHAR